MDIRAWCRCDCTQQRADRQPGHAEIHDGLKRRSRQKTSQADIPSGVKVPGEFMLFYSPVPGRFHVGFAVTPGG